MIYQNMYLKILIIIVLYNIIKIRLNLSKNLIFNLILHKLTLFIFLY